MDRTTAPGARDALEVHVLGPLEVDAAGEAVPLGSAKQRALIGVLLLHAPRPVSVARIVEAVWPDDPPAAPLRSIQVHVSSLRQSFGPAGRALVTQGRAYRLAVEPDQTDVGRFETRAAACRSLLDAGDLPGAVAAADDALGLWRGEAWQDLRQVPGTDVDAARLHEMRLDVQTARLEALLAQGHHRQLVPTVEALTEQHPLREDLVGLLMLALHRCGRQADALGVYSEHRARKVADTGLDPSAAVRGLQARILADDPSLAVEDAMMGARRHLPAAVTGLVGRRDEIDDLVGLLRGDARLVTVTGTGGVGKTRLALQAAHELAADFADGVWFVGLADVTDSALVAQTVAEALGVDDAGSGPAVALRSHLAPRRLLVVLDNLEQVIDAAHLVSDLLAAAAGVRFLATSRVPLRIYGESVRILEPLPEEHAVPLFVERARSSDHRFTAHADDVRVVVNALDRLPLAIELVAARMPEVGVAGALAGLESRLELATHGPRDRARRQQTLRDALAWSVDLLAPDDREAFVRLGVFAGGATPEAAEAVAGGAASGDGLVLASLVARASDGRLRMLEVVREYAAALLAASGQEEDLREAHASYYLAFAESTVAALRGPQRAEVIDRLQSDRANVRRAFDHLVARAAADVPAGTRALRLADALVMFLYHTSPAGPDTEILVRALAAAPEADPLLRARAWHGLAICRGESGRIAEALAASRESVELCRSGGDDAWLARALNTLGGLTRDVGEPRAALPILVECTDLRRRLDDPTTPVGIALENLAGAALDAGDLGLARATITECRQLATDEEDDALALRVLADIALAEGDLAETSTQLAAAVPVLLGADHHRYRLLECLETGAALAAATSRPELAVALVAAIDRALAEDGAGLVPADLQNRERRIGPALARLSAEEVAAARARGGRWSLEDAAQRCLQLTDEVSDRVRDQPFRGA